MKSFKELSTFEERKAESARINSIYPNSIPVVVEKCAKSNLPSIEKKKYLVPEDLTIAQFIHIVRKKINLDSKETMFLYVNGTLPASSSLLKFVYNEHKDEDGFLYILYNNESVFGFQ